MWPFNFTCVAASNDAINARAAVHSQSTKCEVNVKPMDRKWIGNMRKKQIDSYTIYTRIKRKSQCTTEAEKPAPLFV